MVFVSHNNERRKLKHQIAIICAFTGARHTLSLFDLCQVL